MDTRQIFNQFLSNNKVMQLATQSDGELWICNVYFASDEAGNIYWTSARNRRHSVEIENNPAVAVTILNDADKKQAVQISGKAFRVAISESEIPHKIYGEKLGQKDDRLEEVRKNTPESRAYWILKPEFIELWDEVSYPESPKQTVQL